MIYWDRGDLEVCYVTLHRQYQLQPMTDFPLLPVDLAMIPVMPLTQLMGLKEGERIGQGEEGKKKNQIVLFSNNDNNYYY